MDNTGANAGRMGAGSDEDSGNDGGNGPSCARYAAVFLGFAAAVVGIWMLLASDAGSGSRTAGIVLLAFGGAVFVAASALNSYSYRYVKPWPANATVTVSADEARSGISTTVTIKVLGRCGACDATGRRGRFWCPRCRGSGRAGYGAQSRRVEVPPGVPHEAELMLPGLGAPGGRYPGNGDLRLKVRVEGVRTTPPAEPGKRGGSRVRRGANIPPSHARSVSDDAFLVTVVAQPDSSSPQPEREQGREHPDRTAPSGPVTAVNEKGDTEFAVRTTGIRVRDKWPHPAGGARWKTRWDRAWEEIAGLDVDYGTHDSLLALWAVPSDGTQREHVVDVRVFTAAQWTELSRAVLSLSGGRLTLTPAPLNHPAPPRDT